MEFKLRHSTIEDIVIKKSVLIIDDSVDSLYLGRALLERDGFKVFTASSGTEAFCILEKISELNLILLDMHMEDMSGSCFLETLEKRTPEFLSNVPVVFYSAVDEVPMSKAAGFIRKAGDINYFLKQVRSFIELH